MQNYTVKWERKRTCDKLSSTVVLHHLWMDWKENRWNDLCYETTHDDRQHDFQRRLFYISIAISMSVKAVLRVWSMVGGVPRRQT